MTGDLEAEPSPPPRDTDRERDFWDHHIPTLSQAVAAYERGPDPNVQAMLDAVEPRPGRRILDIACGAGITSAWLAATGADVIGVDLSPASTGRATELCEHLGLPARFVVGEFGPATFPGLQFEGLVGRYALHHMEIAAVAPLLAELVEGGGKAAFVETFDTNPVLRFARNHLVGRFGVPRYGTVDEHPLVKADLEVLGAGFESVTVSAPQFQFLRMLDRQVLHHRFHRTSRVLGRTDDLLHQRGVLPTGWSFHQVVVLTKGA